MIQGPVVVESHLNLNQQSVRFEGWGLGAVAPVAAAGAQVGAALVGSFPQPIHRVAG